MKGVVVFLALVCLGLAVQLYRLTQEVDTLQRSAAIAVLSAEIANKKIGAIAPYFEEDKAAFAKAWADDVNMPSAEFPADTLGPLRAELERRRNIPGMRQLVNETFKE